MNPTSKKTGMATRKPAMAIAQVARFLPNTCSRVTVSRSAPPETSSNWPNMAPRPTTTAINPSVPPMPFSMHFITVLGGIPAARAVIILTSSRAINGCIFHLIIRKSRTTTAAITTDARYIGDPIMKCLSQKISPLSKYHLRFVRFLFRESLRSVCICWLLFGLEMKYICLGGTFLFKFPYFRRTIITLILFCRFWGIL